MEQTLKHDSHSSNRLFEFQYAETSIWAGIIATHEAIAIKPVCENLQIDYSWQRKKIENDVNLSQLWLKEKVIAQDGKLREMLCFGFAGFQEWLWGISPTENINIRLWEEYKKGLVIFLMQMLGITLSEVQKLCKEIAPLKQSFEELKTATLAMIAAEDEGKQKSREAKEKFAEVKDYRDLILKRFDPSPGDQLPIPGFHTN